MGDLLVLDRRRKLRAADLEDLIEAARPLTTTPPGAAGYVPSPHSLQSAHHTGSISDTQGPQFAFKDGSGTDRPAYDTKRMTAAVAHVLPNLTDTYDLGDSTKWWRSQYVSQINAAIYAEQTIQILGGWLVVGKNEGPLGADVASGATTVDFGQAMTVSDFVVIKAHDSTGTAKTEYMQVGALVSGTTYNVTRDVAGAHTPDPAWAKGTPYLVLGQTGAGRIELNSTDTPRIQILTQGATYNAQTEMARFGDLNGNWGYVAETYGIAIGSYAASAPNITVDTTNGLRIRNYTADVLKFDTSGNSTVEGTLAVNGAITGGGGTVRLASTGLEVLTGFLAINSVAWYDSFGGTKFGAIATSISGAAPDRSGTISVAGYKEGSGTATVNLAAGTSWVSLIQGTVNIGAADLNVGQGLNVGTATGAGTGEIKASAALTISPAPDPAIVASGTDAGHKAIHLVDSTSGEKWSITHHPGADGNPLSMHYYSGSTWSEVLRVGIGGEVDINPAADNAKMTQGLTIQQGANDDEILALKSSDVAHGITRTETDTYGLMAKSVATTGGLNVEGYSEDKVALGLVGVGVTDETGARSTSSSGYIVLAAGKKQGDNTAGAAGADANLVVIRNWATTRYVWDAEGSAFADVEWTTFDQHDDVDLLAKLEGTMLAWKDPVKREFAGFLSEHREELERLNVVHFDRGNPGHAMLNTTRLSMLLVGAVRQLSDRLARAEARLLPAG